MRETCPWQRTGGVVDHQMVDIIVCDAGSVKPNWSRGQR
jgi:hypothetical protein